MDKEKLQKVAQWVGIAISIVLAVFALLGAPIQLGQGGFEAETVRYGQYGNSWFHGLVRVDSDLDVDGTTNLDDMDIDLSSEFEIDGALVDIGGGTGGTADGDNDLLVAGDVEVDDTLDVDGDIDLNGDGFDVDITAGASIDADGATNLSTSTNDITIDAEAGSVTIIGSEAAADSISLDANDTVTSGLTIVVGSVSGMSVDGGLTDFGGGTYTTANGDNDVGINGDLEVNGSTDLDGVVNMIVGTEHIGAMSVVTTAVTYQSSGAIFTVADGEIWIVHAVLVNVTTNFDTGANNDATMIIGDGNDDNGFIDLADAELQASDTEGTGFAAGWQGLVPATQGVYIDSAAGSNYFIYAPSGAAETIDITCGGTGLDAGAATVYVIYTRIQ